MNCLPLHPRAQRCDVTSQGFPSTLLAALFDLKTCTSLGIAVNRAALTHRIGVQVMYPTATGNFERVQGTLHFSPAELYCSTVALDSLHVLRATHSYQEIS